MLYALIDGSHVNRARVQQWFPNASGGCATCPITQGTLLRLVMRLGGHGVEQALALLGAVTAHAQHHFWPDELLYEQVCWHGVMGHRQVTDAYLAGLAQHHEGKLASFDKGLVALHADVKAAVDA